MRNGDRQPPDDAIADAWYPPDKLERQRQAEQAERDFRQMLERRRRFTESLAEVNDPTAAERRDLWAAADEETNDAHSE